MAPIPHIQAWIYPDAPACSAPSELTDGRHIDTVKPQYFTLGDTGLLTQISDRVCNGYSLANASLIKMHSTHQFVTISGSIAGIMVLATDRTRATRVTRVLTSFLRTTGFTGVELDIEGYSRWLPDQYRGYKRGVTALGTILHTAGYKLMLDGPSIMNTLYQGYYLWKYEDFNTLPVDYLVSMCYDFQYDNGAHSPVSSLRTITGCCKWMLAKVSDPSKIIIGLNSYGYHGTPGAFSNLSNDTYKQSRAYPGFASATRDRASGELMWTKNGVFYDCSDTTTLDTKLQAVLTTGITNVSIWHLGGNQWFRRQKNTTATPMTSPLQDVLLPPFNAISPDDAITHFESQEDVHD